MSETNGVERKPLDLDAKTREMVAARIWREVFNPADREMWSHKGDVPPELADLCRDAAERLHRDGLLAARRPDAPAPSNEEALVERLRGSADAWWSEYDREVRAHEETKAALAGVTAERDALAARSPQAAPSVSAEVRVYGFHGEYPGLPPLFHVSCSKHRDLGHCGERVDAEAFAMEHIRSRHVGEAVTVVVTS